MAVGGQFQQNPPQGKTFQLLRLRLDASLDWIPRSAATAWMVSIRFMRQGPDDRPHPGAEDTPFELTLCA